MSRQMDQIQLLDHICMDRVDLFDQMDQMDQCIYRCHCWAELLVSYACLCHFVFIPLVFD